jgi:glycosyltransferase involved in cell wall biosynthesis
MGLFCKGLVERGHAVQVVTGAGNGQESVGDGCQMTVDQRLRLMMSGNLPPCVLFRQTRHNLKAVRRVIRRFAPDVVFCGGFDGIGFNTYLASIESGRPSLTWLGDTWLAQAWRNLRRYDPWANLAAGGGRPGVRRLIKQAIGCYGRLRGLYDGPHPKSFRPVATLSQFVLDDLRESGAPVPDDTKVIPVCLHPEFFDSTGEPLGHSGKRMTHLRALFVGRMQLLKGPDTAVRALANAVNRGANVRLSFAGLKMDELRPYLHDLAGSLGVADRIDWHGTPTVGQLIELYQNHDVFLFPSRIVEGLGVVNVEALACGLPIIGTAHSGSAEVIIAGKTGFRVEKDDAESMGRHLVELHTDRGLLARLSESVPEYAKRFAPSRVVEDLETELFKVIGRSSTMQ